MENGITIFHKGKPYDIDLTEHDADRISNLSAIVKFAPVDPEPVTHRPAPLTEEQERNRQHYEDYAKVATDFQVQIKRIANLSEYKMPLLLAFLDVIELEDLGMSETNWMYEFITESLHSVVHKGAARALHVDPRGMLADLAADMYAYWQWVRDSREVLKAHPEFFPAPLAEPAVTPKPAKRQGARKSRKAAS